MPFQGKLLLAPLHRPGHWAWRRESSNESFINRLIPAIWNVGLVRFYKPAGELQHVSFLGTGRNDKGSSDCANLLGIVDGPYRSPGNISQYLFVPQAASEIAGDRFSALSRRNTAQRGICEQTLQPISYVSI